VRRRTLIFHAAAFLPPLVIYSLTRARTWSLDTLYTIDSAEMVLAASTLGIDHPPGHPLYLILAHLFSLLPFQRPDEGVVFCSVISMSAASGLLALAIRLRTGNDLAALAAGWSFAFGLVIWFHATIAEVYAVQLACIAAFYALIARWLTKGQLPTFFALCFILGITATSNVLLAVLLLPGLAYITWRSGLLAVRRQPAWLLPICFGCIVLGASPLLYIPIRLGADGFVSDFVYLNGYTPGSLRWYLWYLSAEEFTATKILSTPASAYPGLVTAYVGSFLGNHSPFLAVLSLLGMLVTCRHLTALRSIRSLTASLAPTGPAPQVFERCVFIGLVATLVPVLPYQVADREVFYMPSFVHLILLGGIGIWRILDAIRHSTIPAHAQPWLIAPLVAIGPLFLLTSHYGTVDAVTADTSSYDDRKTRFLALPNRAIVTSTDDGRATRWKYWQTVLGLRPDVQIETLGKLAPRYRPEDSDTQATGAANVLAPTLNLADRLRVLKGLRATYPDRPLFTILDDRLPPELDHFRIRRSTFDGRLLRLTDKPPLETSSTPITSQVSSAQDSFEEIDVIGIDITSLDQGISRAFREPVPVKANVVNGIIRRSEFVEIEVVLQKRASGQYFGELAFVDQQMRIPGARGFSAARTLEVASEDLAQGDFLKQRLTIKIPGFIPGGLHTLAFALNAVSHVEAGTYKGKALKRMVPVQARRQWVGQTRYQPLAQIWIE
jgi:hypothetical protein